jgi:hypothetical protein
MAGIDDFITSASRDLGEPEQTTRAATGALLGAIRQHANSSDFDQLLRAIPGASGLMGPPVRRSAGSGLLGSVLGSAASKLGLGSSATSALGLVGSIHSTGFSVHNTGRLVSMFMQFVRSNTDSGLTQKLMRDVPDLGRM